MDTQREFTPQQLKLIEKHRDINVEFSDWHDFTIYSFVETCAEWGIGTEVSQVRYSGFWSPGDGASFTGDFRLGELLDAGDARTAADDFDPETLPPVEKALHALYCALYDVFGPERLVVPEIREMAADVSVAIERSPGYYSHSGYMNANFDCILEAWTNPEPLETEAGTVVESEAMYAMRMAVVNRIRTLNEKWRCYSWDDEAYTDMLRAVADALYAELEAEYEDQTSDEQVWGSIEASGLDTEVDEDEED